MPRHARWPIALLLALLGGGCNQILGIEPGILDPGDAAADAIGDAGGDGGRDGPRDATADAADPADAEAAADAAAPDAGPRCAALCGTTGCGACPTTPMTTGDLVQIDVTEVTNAAYAAWLATSPDPGFQATRCAWNATFEPLVTFEAGMEDRPVAGVDWCDAYAYCTWARKRLCGKNGGGALPYADGATLSSQWFRACKPAVGAYPYGAAYTANRCNGLDHLVGTTVDTGTMPLCEGSYSGLFDMSGNVAEWEDSCNGDQYSTDLCHVRGGSFESGQAQLTCDDAAAQTRATLNPAIGFRCCGS